MKKLSVLFLVLFLICTTSSCGNKQTPEYVATQYLTGVATMDYSKMDTVSVVPYETMMEEMLLSASKEYGKTTEELYEQLAKSYEFESTPKNYKEYVDEYHKYITKGFQEQYGDDFEIEVSIISITDLLEDDMATLLKEATDQYDKYNIVISDIADFSSITECKQVNAKIYYKGSKADENDTEDIRIYLVKIENEWKVLNIGMG